MLSNEDQTSKALAKLLNNSVSAKMAFCEMVLPIKSLAGEARALAATPQYPIAYQKRIDILLSDAEERSAIIVECKIRDSIKPFQLEDYYDYWKEKHGYDPVLVALVQQRQDIRGRGTKLAKTITWNELYQRFLSGEPCRETAAFCRDLKRSGIVSNSEPPARTKRCRGYQQDRAEYILGDVCKAISGLLGSVEEMNELPPYLKCGRESWAPKFKPQRLRIYLKPLEGSSNTHGPFGFRVHLLLHRRGEFESYESILPLLPRWIDICHQAGLKFMRNRPGKWRGNEHLPYPFKLPSATGLKRICAYANDPEEIVTGFDWRDDAAAVRAGVKELTKFLRIADRF